MYGGDAIAEPLAFMSRLADDDVALAAEVAAFEAVTGYRNATMANFVKNLSKLVVTHRQASRTNVLTLICATSEKMHEPNQLRTIRTYDFPFPACHPPLLPRALPCHPRQHPALRLSGDGAHTGCGAAATAADTP